MSVGTSVAWEISQTSASELPSPTRAVAMGSPIATTEPNARNSTITAAVRPTASAPRGSGRCVYSTSGPPVSTWSPVRRAGATAAARRSAAVRPSSARDASYRTVEKAVVRSAETPPSPPGWVGSATDTTWGSAATRARVVRIACIAAGSASVPVRAWNTTMAVTPARSGKRSRSSSMAAWASAPGMRKSSTNAAPASRPTEKTPEARSAHAAITGHGRWAAPRPAR
ncbi:MAG: hypothetical protein KatS3mg014_0563 [Actinomycetota bacterium]|nr:MAG: hypothetical protein KatS3mg014_0563 [Actinomycetota bacterium]